MKTLITLSLLALSLTACSNQLPLPAARPNSLQAQAASQPRLFETFKAYLNHSQYDQSGLAEMLMTVRSMLGSTYDNRNSASRYHLYYSGQDSFLAEAIGTIRLGRDNGLYLEDMNFNNGQKTLQYYRLGSFQLAPGARDGQDISFTLDQGNSVKMKWRGINPMNHEEIHLTINPAIKPVQKDPASFF